MNTTVALSAHGLHVNAAPTLIQAGTLHYFRLPHPRLWAPVLGRIRMAGFNAVRIPFPWSYHSPEAGLYDFTGLRDLNLLLDAVEGAGLWLVADIGPWVDADLDSGGVPSWFFQVPGVLPNAADPASLDAAPSFAFLRYVREWWTRLLPMLIDRPNLLAFILDPGRFAASGILSRYIRPLAEMLKTLSDPASGGYPPCLWRAHVGDGGEGLSMLRWQKVELNEVAHLTEPDLTNVTAVDVHGEPAFRFGGDSREQIGHLLGESHPRLLLGDLAVRLGRYHALSPVHAGVSWGYWGLSENCTAYGVAAPIQEGAELSASYYHARRMAFTLESLGDMLALSQPTQNIYASQPQHLSAARSHAAAAIAFLTARDEEFRDLRLSLVADDAMLTTEPLQMSAPEACVLPLNWDVAGGTLHLTTLEPLLRTSVAGRHLLVLANVRGGDVLLSDDFRPQHSRGPVRTQRTQNGLAVHFDAAKVSSLLLDGPDGVLQLLAFSVQFAERVWPLDDSWRATPAYPAAWNPAPEDPARGLVIGPDFVLPRADGGYDYLVGQKGFGYRWGPWRGSDPRTWLAPIMWSAPASLQLPDLRWESRGAAPELDPDFDDGAWQQIAATAPLSFEAHSIAQGFAWYRGYFSGDASTLSCRCDDAYDVFLNGEHIAMSNAPTDGMPSPLKTLPLPARLLREINLLSILVERQGNAKTWNSATRLHGLLFCALDSGQPLRWRLRAGLSAERSLQGFAGYADWTSLLEDGSSNFIWHRTTFDLHISPTMAVPIFLYLDQVPTKAYIFLNGQLIGRYWEMRGPQHRFWLPGGILQRNGNNEILIMQWTRGAEPGVGLAHLEAGNVMQWHQA